MCKHLLFLQKKLVLLCFLLAIPWVMVNAQCVGYGVGVDISIPPTGTGDANCGGGPTEATIAIAESGQIGVDYEINEVGLNLTHTFDGDLDISLISPSGTTLALSSGNGGAGDDYSNTTFQDGGGDITNASAPFSDTYEPQGGRFAATFDGEDVNGIWTLSICDNFSGDPGTLLGFNMSICGFEPSDCEEAYGDNFGATISSDLACTQSVASVTEVGTIGNNATIDKVNLDLTHTFDGDLNMSLISPSGTALALSSGNGGAGDDYINTTFQDGGGDITNASPPFSATYEPQGGTFAAAFGGEDVAGDWILEVCDNAAGDEGTLNFFSIEVCTEEGCVEPMVSIDQDGLSMFCQGYASLTANIANMGNLAPPLTYVWSTGETTPTITATANGMYTVMVTTGDNCMAEAMINVNVDEVETMSTYVVVAGENLELSGVTVQSGGVGVLDADEVEVEDNTSIATFLTSADLDMDGSSIIATWNEDDADFDLPAFSANPEYNYTTLTVAAGSTMTLSASSYGSITVENGATLIFDNANVNINKLTTKDNVSVEFTGATVLRSRKGVRLGRYNDFNVAAEDVIVYSKGDVDVKQGSNVSGVVYTQNSIEVNDSGASADTYMTGMFIAEEDVTAGENTFWNWNLDCADVSAPLVQGNTPSIVQPTATANVLVYPNPSNGVVNLELQPFLGQSVNIIVTNTLGEVMWTRQIGELENPVFTQDLTNTLMVSGLYHITFVGEKETITRNLVISK